MSSRNMLLAWLTSFVAFGFFYYYPSYSAALSWLGNHEHRLPNVRLIDESCRAAFVRKFIDLQDWNKPTISVFGDSHPFGSGHPFENTWASLLVAETETPMQVINLSVIDGRLKDSAYIASLVPKSDLSVVNLNQSHYAEDPHRHVPSVSSSILEFELCVWQLQKFLRSERLTMPSDGRVHENFRRIKLLQHRYDGDKIRRDEIETSIDQISKTANATFIYITPNDVSNFEHYKFDLATYRQTSQSLLEICNHVSENCIDLSESIPAGNFSDIVHLNTRGQKLFAEKIKAAMQ